MTNNFPTFYKVLNENSVYKIGSISLKSISQNDIELIRVWRNNQSNILRQKENISKNSQEEYYKKNVWNEMSLTKPKKILLSIFRNDLLVGYGGLVNISWDDKRAEMSFLLSDKYLDEKILYGEIFSDFIFLIKKIGFTELNLNRIFTETYDIRPFHISILEKNNFQLEGRMKSHLIIDNKKVDSLIHGCLKNNEK